MADPFTLIRCVDVESTGIDDPAEIVEIGHTDVRLYPGTGWQIDSEPHSWLVNPGMPITFPAMAVRAAAEISHPVAQPKPAAQSNADADAWRKEMDRF